MFLTKMGNSEVKFNNEESEIYLWVINFLHL